MIVPRITLQTPLIIFPGAVKWLPLLGTRERCKRIVDREKFRNALLGQLSVVTCGWTHSCGSFIIWDLKALEFGLQP